MGRRSSERSALSVWGLGRIGSPNVPGEEATSTGGRCRRQRSYRGLHVFTGDPSSRPGSADGLQVESGVTSQLANDRQRLHGCRNRSNRLGNRLDDLGLLDQCSNDGGDFRRLNRGFLPHGLVLVANHHQHGADLDRLSLGSPVPYHYPLVRRGNLNNGLVCLHFDDWLIGVDRVSFGDQPADNLGLGEAFAHVGKSELANHYSFNVLLAAAVI